MTGVEAAQRASGWLVRFTTDTALEGDAFSLSYGSVALTAGETKTEGWAYVCENGGVALTIDFDNVPANYGGRVSVAANTISSGATGGYIKITNNYSFILLNGTAHEDKTYTVEIKNGDTVLTSITYDVLDREAKLTALKAAINGLTPPEHYYYEVNLPETLPEENCSYAVTVKPIEYDVIIGDAVAVKVAYGEKLTKPESDPTKDMTVDKVYTFDGWYNGDKKWDFETDTVQGDTTLVARFNESAREYDVKFGEDATAKVAYGSKLTKPETDPTKDMTVDKVYTFDGWYNGETKWNFDTDTVKDDVTLVAKFTETARKYTVTITFVGLEKDEVTLQVEYNGTVDFSAYAEDGYNMTIKNGETEITELTVTGDVNITITYAKKPAAAKKGCGGSVGGLGVMLTALGFAAVVFKKKRG